MLKTTEIYPGNINRMDKIIQENELNELVRKKLQSVGLNAEHSGIVADVLTNSDMRGVRSHGTMRLEHYCARITAGGINLNASYEFKKTATAAGVLDADGGMGHVAANIATDIAIKQAKETGIFAMVVKNSSHAGALSFFGEKAVDSGMIAILMANTDKCVTPFGSAEGYNGTNPIAFCYPGKKHSIILDMATSEGAFGKIYVAKEKGESIPESWAVDGDGVPTTDPSKAVYLLPFGGHKGTGLALSIEALTGVGNGAFGPHVVAMYGDTMGTYRNTSAFIMMIDPNIYGNGDAYYDNLDQMVDEIHALRPAKDVKKVLLPGEIEKDNEARARKDGVPVYENVYKFLMS